MHRRGVYGVGMDPVDVTDSTVYSANVHAGTASAAASWDGDDDHTGNTGSSTFVIGQASSTVTVDCTAGAPYTYQRCGPGAVHRRRVGMDPVDVTDSIVYSANVHAGTASAAASWDGDDDQHRQHRLVHVRHRPGQLDGDRRLHRRRPVHLQRCGPGAVHRRGDRRRMDPVDVTDSIVYSANVHAGTASAAASSDATDGPHRQHRPRPRSSSARPARR